MILSICSMLSGISVTTRLFVGISAASLPCGDRNCEISPSIPTFVLAPELEALVAEEDDEELELSLESELELALALVARSEIVACPPMSRGDVDSRAYFKRNTFVCSSARSPVAA